MKKYESNSFQSKRPRKSSSEVVFSSPIESFEGLSELPPSLAGSFDPTHQQSLDFYTQKKTSSRRDLSALLGSGASYTPYITSWSDNRTIQVRNFKHWIYICVDLYASKIASKLPNVSYLRVSDSPEGHYPVLPTSSNGLPHHLSRCLPPWKREKALLPLLTEEHLEPVPWNHPLCSLLRNPNEPDTSYDLWYETVMYLKLTGSAYWYIPKHPTLKLPSAIWVVPSHWVWPILGPDRHIDNYEIRPVEGNYMRMTIPADEIIHFHTKNPIRKIDGYSPLSAVSHWGDIMNSLNQSWKSVYDNGTFPTVAIQFDGKLNDPTEATLQRIEAKFVNRYVGGINVNKPLFLPPGVSVKPLTITANRMLFGETGQQTAHNICHAFHVPTGFFDPRADFAACLALFNANALNPLCFFLGQTISEKFAQLYSDSQDVLKVWWEGWGTEDPKQVNEDIKTDLLGWAITPDEIRIKRGRAPLNTEWSSQPIGPVNMAPGALALGGEHSQDSGLDDGLDQPALNDDDYKALVRNGHKRFSSNGI